MNQKQDRGDLIPRHPQIRTTTDFIVIVFVIMVATILMLLTIAAIAAGLFTDDDVSNYLTIITDLMGAIIAALVGFVAGRGVGRQEQQQGPP